MVVVRSTTRPRLVTCCQNRKVRSSVHKGHMDAGNVPVVVRLIPHPTVNSPLLSLGLLDVIVTVVS